MRHLSFILFFFLSCAKSVTASDEVNFKHHNFELSAAWGLDHQFIVGRNADPVTAHIWKDAERPFTGFSLGFGYTYRPFHILGISTGLEYLQYGSRSGKLEEYDPTTNIYTTSGIINGYIFAGSIGVPVYLHFYQRLKKYEIEYVVGPQFFFNLYSLEKIDFINYDTVGISGKFNNTLFLNSTAIKQSASVAFSVQVILDIPVKKALVVSLGPEWKLLELKRLYSYGYPVYHSDTRVVPFFLGLKATFRLGYDFANYKKMTVKA